MDAVEFKVRAQSLGVRLEGCPAITRRGGAGPAEGLCLLFAGLEATVPVSPAFVRESPFSLVGAEGEGYRVMEGGRELFEAEPAPDPAYYNYTTSDGTPMRRIAVRHSRDCLGSTLLQTCSRLPRCGFCAIDLSLEQGLTTARKSPEQLLEVATIAVDEGFTHAVLTTGTPPEDDRGLAGLAAGAAALEAAGLATHVQFEPPEDPGSMDRLAGAATSAGIHIESFDEASPKEGHPGQVLRHAGGLRRGMEIGGGTAGGRKGLQLHHRRSGRRRPHQFWKGRAFSLLSGSILTSFPCGPSRGPRWGAPSLPRRRGCSGSTKRPRRSSAKPARGGRRRGGLCVVRRLQRHHPLHRLKAEGW